MVRLLAGAAVVAGLSLVGCKQQDEQLVQPSETAAEAPTPYAEPTPEVAMTNQVAGAQLSGPSGAAGVVTFTQEATGVHVVARVQGLTPGPHGFHLHAGSACEGDFKSAGDHFNPGNTPHGGPAAAQHHAGDFGNVEVAADGIGNLDLVTDALSIGSGANDVLGKAVILHQGSDDLTTQPSGNSGARVACGVVQRAQGQAVTDGAATPAPATY
jgi:Cu-Zn family superoxide dismutase